MHLILGISRRLEIPAVVGKLELLLRSGIELSQVGDRVLELLVDRAEGAVDTNFPVVTTVVPGEIPTAIELTIAAILAYDDRRS